MNSNEFHDRLGGSKKDLMKRGFLSQLLKTGMGIKVEKRDKRILSC